MRQETISEAVGKLVTHRTFQWLDFVKVEAGLLSNVGEWQQTSREWAGVLL